MEPIVIPITEPIVIPITEPIAIEVEETQHVYNLIKTVKCFSIIDCIYVFSFILLSPYFSIFAIINLFICWIAYIGCKSYNKYYLIPYIIMNILKNFLTLYIIIIFNIINQKNQTNIILHSIYFLLSIYISFIIINSYINLSNLTNDQINFLRIRFI